MYKEATVARDSHCTCLPDKLYWFLQYSNFTSPVRESSYPVKTVIKNPVLAWFNLLGKILLAFYLIYMFFHESLYNKLSVPNVHVDYWADEADGTSTDENDYVYCNNNTYDYIYSEAWHYTNNKCTRLQYGESYDTGDWNFFFFATYFEENTYARRWNCTPDDYIFDDVGLSYENCTITSSESGTVCDCADWAYYFVMGAEESHLAFSLSYFVSAPQVNGWSSDNDVKVVLLDHQGNQYKKLSNNHNYINYPVQEYLLAAGINLDDLNPFAPGVNGSLPYYRMTGVTLILDVQFYNMPIYHKIDEWSGYTVGMVQVRPEKGWSSMGSSITYHEYPNLKDKSDDYYFTDRYRYGVKFIFYDGGYIGHVDRVTIQNYFITSIVLFAVIPALVSRIGLLLFGFHSKIYQEQLKRHPDGMIREMQHFFDTFNFLFNDYDSYIVGNIGRESSDCCCLNMYRFYSQKKDTVTRIEWEKFCITRGIEKQQEEQMWFEINNNPLLATKDSFDSNTLWKAVHMNYDKVSGRIDRTELKTLIMEKWKIWDQECNEENTRRYQERNETNSMRSQDTYVLELKIL